MSRRLPSEPPANVVRLPRAQKRKVRQRCPVRAYAAARDACLQLRDQYVAPYVRAEARLARAMVQIRRRGAVDAGNLLPLLAALDDGAPARVRDFLAGPEGQGDPAEVLEMLLIVMSGKPTYGRLTAIRAALDIEEA